MEDFWLLLLNTLASAIRLGCPLILAAMGGILAERSGIVDIGLEAKMLAGAFAAAAVAWLSGSPWPGLLAGMAAGVAFSLLHGLATIRYRGDQVVSGMALNFIALGLTMVLGQAWFEQGGQTPPLEEAQRFTPIILPGAQGWAQQVPVLGDFYRIVLSGHSWLVYAAFALVPLLTFVLGQTRFGLRLRAAGEEPNALETAGVSVAGVRLLALVAAGVLCGAAGAYISTAQNAGFGRDMTAGSGYIALAAVIFGKWRPQPVLWACLLFGLMTALEARLQGQSLPGLGTIPTQVFQVLPYVLTVILLAGFIGKATPPKALGRPYVKER
ncbi:MAG: ABC transporter permease [Comamonas sp.]